MPREQSPGKPTTRRYSDEEKVAAVRMVRTLRAELGSEHGTVKRAHDVKHFTTPRSAPSSCIARG